VIDHHVAMRARSLASDALSIKLGGESEIEIARA